MIIFAITTNIELQRKPVWLDAFVQKHNKTKHEFHITLKQRCIISEDQIPTIKNILSEYISKEKPGQIEIVFDKLYIDASEKSLTGGDGCIMIETTNDDILKLQKDVAKILSQYRDYAIPEAKSYEDNFRPHITITSDLNKEEFEAAKTDLSEDLLCQGKVTQLRLIIVRDYIPKRESQEREVVCYNLE